MLGGGSRGEEGPAWGGKDGSGQKAQDFIEAGPSRTTAPTPPTLVFHGRVCTTAASGVDECGMRLVCGCGPSGVRWPPRPPRRV